MTGTRRTSGALLAGCAMIILVAMTCDAGAQKAPGVDDNRTKKQRLDAGKSFKAPGCPEGSIPEGATRRCGNQICTAKGGHRYCRPAR